jgi:hypothetical protein
MRCAEFESRLNELLDERLWLDADSSLAEHAQTCSECCKLAASYEALVVGLNQTRLPQPGADLTSRILANVASRTAGSPRDEAVGVPFGRISPASAEGRSARWSTSRIGVAVAAMAAAVLLAVAMRWGAVDPAKQPGQNQDLLAARQKPGDKVAAKTPDAAALKQAAAKANTTPREKLDPYRGLAAETSQSFGMAMQLLPGLGASAKNAGDATAAEPASGWVHGVSDGLKPVTRPTAGAVNSFLELLATGDGGSRS